jgi:hypothetical protein
MAEQIALFEQLNRTGSPNNANCTRQEPGGEQQD